MIPDEILTTVDPIINSVASDASRKYRRYGGDTEDFIQEGWLWLYQHPTKVMEWFDGDRYAPREAERLLARSLHNACTDYGEDIKAQAVGYNRDDVVYYSKQYVKELLPSMFDREAWIHPEQGDGERLSRGGDPAVGGNWIATLADVSRAYDQMEEADRDILWAFHSVKMTNNELAEIHNVTKQRMSDLHDRAVRRLVDLLGGTKPRPAHDADCDHGWTGGRRAVSNAAARQQLESYWEEERRATSPRAS